MASWFAKKVKPEELVLASPIPKDEGTDTNPNWNAESGTGTVDDPSDLNKEMPASLFYTFDEAPEHELPLPPRELDPGQHYDNPERDKWETRFDFLVSMVGFSLDISNVWRFPYLCFKYQGVVFFIPYFVMLTFCALPIFYLELIIGQFTREGIVGMWKICPIFRGVGYATLVVTYVVTYAYNVVLSWTLLYSVASWMTPLPWTTCDNEWNTVNCVHISDEMEQSQRPGASLAGKEYFHGNVLQHMNYTTKETFNIHNLGPPILLNVIYLTLVYFMLIIFLIRGIRNTVKIMWLSTGLPLIILGVMAFRGLTLPGSFYGLHFLMNPKAFKRLAEIEIWYDAAALVFYTTGIGFGIHLTFASFNKFHHNIFRDCIIALSINTLTNMISLLVVFSFLGSTEEDIIFEMFPDALGRLPSSHFFAFFFYIMLFLLAFACVLAALQCVISSLKDELKGVVDLYRSKTALITTFAVGLSYAIGIVTLTRGGYDVYDIIAENVATSSLLFCTLFQLIGVAWVYGIDNVCRAEYAMNGKVPNLFFRICWKYVSPFTLMGLIVGDFIYGDAEDGDPVTIRIKKYVGYFLSVFPLLIILVVAWVQVFRIKGPHKLLCLISPDIEHEEIRETNEGARKHWKHWKSLCKGRRFIEVSSTNEPNGKTRASKDIKSHSLSNTLKRAPGEEGLEKVVDPHPATETG